MNTFLLIPVQFSIIPKCFYMLSSCTATISPLSISPKNWSTGVQARSWQDTHHAQIAVFDIIAISLCLHLAFACALHSVVSKHRFQQYSGKFCRLTMHMKRNGMENTEWRLLEDWALRKDFFLIAAKLQSLQSLNADTRG